MSASRDKPADNWGSPLTPRQAEVLRLIAAGKTDKEAAAALGISEETVAHHMRVMFHDHRVHCRAALIAKLSHWAEAALDRMNV